MTKLKQRKAARRAIGEKSSHQEVGSGWADSRVTDFFQDKYDYWVRRVGTRFPDVDAEAVVMDSFIRLANGIDKFRGDSSLNTYFFRIIHNQARTVLGKANKETCVDPQDPLQVIMKEVDELDVGRTVVDAELSTEGIKRQLEFALRPRSVKIVLLRAEEGMRHQDVAEKLGISETAAKVALSRARRDLNEAGGREAFERRVRDRAA
ncbi:MAG: sigma-70 family RNA polymerase sigma factor [Patescibacteria group bacterium]